MFWHSPSAAIVTCVTAWSLTVTSSSSAFLSASRQSESWLVVTSEADFVLDWPLGQDNSKSHSLEHFRATLKSCWWMRYSEPSNCSVLSNSHLFLHEPSVWMAYYCWIDLTRWPDGHRRIIVNVSWEHFRVEIRTMLYCFCCYKLSLRIILRCFQAQIQDLNQLLALWLTAGQYVDVENEICRTQRLPKARRMMYELDKPERRRCLWMMSSWKMNGSAKVSPYTFLALAWVIRDLWGRDNQALPCPPLVTVRTFGN